MWLTKLLCVVEEESMNILFPLLILLLFLLLSSSCSFSSSSFFSSLSPSSFPLLLPLFLLLHHSLLNLFLSLSSLSPPPTSAVHTSLEPLILRNSTRKNSFTYLTLDLFPQSLNHSSSTCIYLSRKCHPKSFHGENYHKK